MNTKLVFRLALLLNALVIGFLLPPTVEAACNGAYQCVQKNIWDFCDVSITTSFSCNGGNQSACLNSPDDCECGIVSGVTCFWDPVPLPTSAPWCTDGNTGCIGKDIGDACGSGGKCIDK